jgi:hypothetical protein
MNIPKFEIKYKGYNFLADSEVLMFDNINKFLNNKKISYDRDELLLHIQKNLKPNSAFSGGESQSEKRLNKVYQKRLTFKDVVNGAKALLNTSLGNTVDQEEITRRGRICASCPRKQLTTDCYGCGFSRVLSKFIGNLKNIFGKEVSLHSDVKGSYCDVCGCALSIMIPSKLDAFNETQDKQDARPEYCWLKKNSPNYNP